MSEESRINQTAASEREALDQLAKELGGGCAFERVMWSLGDLVSIQNRGFDIIYQNQAMIDKHGDIKGMKCFTAYERTANCPDCYLTRVFADGEVVRAERTGFLDNGETRHFEITASPLRDPEGRIFAGVEVLRDVTARKRIEAELGDKTAVCEAQNLEMTSELKLARKVQQALIPAPKTVVGDIEVHVRYQPFDLVGGDMADVIHLPDGVVGLAVADVSGHGVASSLVASMLKASITHLARINPSPAHVLARINEQIVDLLEDIKYLTMALAFYHPGDRTLVWATAGHPPILLHRQNGEMVELISKSMFLGYSHGVKFEDSASEIEPGDRIIFITDGIYECFNSKGEMFGEERFMELLKNNRSTAAAELCDLIFAAQQRFTDGHPLPDDATLLIADIR